MSDFPIMQPWRSKDRVVDAVTRIPWAMIAPHEFQAVRNHGGQSLDRLAERGGLSANEAVCVLEDRKWSASSETDAQKHLRRLLDAWRSKS